MKSVLAAVRVRLKTIIGFLVRHLNPFLGFKKWWAMKGFKKWLILAVTLGALFLIGSQILSFINRGKPDLGKYEIERATLQDMERTITKEGILRYSGVIDYPAPSSGIITDVWVQDGDTVTKGQRIVNIQSTASPKDQADAWNQYAAAKSAYEAAKTVKMTKQVNLEAARQDVLHASQERQNMENRFVVGNRINTSANRPDKTFTDNEIEAVKSEETQARSKFTIAEREYNTADLAVQAAEAALAANLWKYQLTKDAIITAPVSGRLTNFNVLKGETIHAPDGILFRIITSDDMTIILKASESEVMKFQIGQETQFTTALYPDTKFKGTIISLDLIGTEVATDNGSVIEYIVKIKPEQTDATFPSPLTVDTETVVERKSMALAIPNAAVTYSSGKRTVMVVQNGKTTIRDVTLGIMSDQVTEITSGLSEGDTILVPKAKKL